MLLVLFIFEVFCGFRTKNWTNYLKIVVMTKSVNWRFLKNLKEQKTKLVSPKKYVCFFWCDSLRILFYFRSMPTTVTVWMICHRQVKLNQKNWLLLRMRYLVVIFDFWVQADLDRGRSELRMRLLGLKLGIPLVWMIF